MTCAGPADTSAREWTALRRGLVLVPVDNGLIVEGGIRRHLLRGAAPTHVLPSLPGLVSMLTGDHAPADIAEALGLDPDKLAEFLALLDGCGLREEAGQQPGMGGGTSDDVTAFLSRTAPAVRQAGKARPLAVLARSGVMIVAPPWIREQVADDLSETGVALVVTADRAGEIPSETMSALAACPHRIAAVFDCARGISGADELEEIVASCGDHGIPALRFGWGEGGPEIGPTFQGGHPACVDCFRRARRAEADGADGWRPPAADRAEAALLAGLVTNELLAVLAGVTEAAPAGTLIRMTLPGCDSERFVVAPEAGCPRCGRYSGAVAALSRGAALAEEYEWLHSWELARSAPSRTGSHSDGRRRSEWLARNDRAYAPRIRLVDTRPDSDLARPAGYLRQLAGWRPVPTPGDALRMDPCGDDVPSVQAYLLTNGAVGRPASFFKYDGLSHELVAVCASQLPLSHSLAGTDLNPLALDFAIVLVAAVGELRRSFGDFALRLSLLDVGAAAAQLSAAATADGRPVAFAARWTSDLAHLLELDPEREIVGAVAGVGRGPHGGAACH